LQDPNSPTACNNYAYSLAKRDTAIDYAMELAQRAIADDSTSATYLDTYGWLKYKASDYVPAIEYLEKASAIDSTNYEIYEHLSDVYKTLNNIDAAREALDKAINIAPNDTDLLKKRTLLIQR
jgi:tetratricopeptide (TPR) repeat protein